MKKETEDNIQNEIVVWFRKKHQHKNARLFAIIYAIPNGGSRKGFEAMNMRFTGTLAGVTDLHIVHSGGVEFVEVKTDKGGLLPSQLRFKEMLSLAGLGHKWHMVRSLEEFKEVCYKIFKL